MEWQTLNNQLEKTFKAKSFSQITERLVDIGRICDEIDHHPDVAIFNYKFVTFRLITHSENKITDKDYNLAKQIDTFFE